MIYRLLRIIYVLEQYRIPIDAYIDGVRGDDLKKICLEIFMGSPPMPLEDMMGPDNTHLWRVEKFFNKRTNFAGMLP